jgi:putative membrane protein
VLTDSVATGHVRVSGLENFRGTKSLTEQPDDRNRGNPRDRVTDHLANERTYLAWLRTGIATIGLGFVVAKFGLALRELTGISAIPETSYHLSSIIGIALTVVGGLMILLAFSTFAKNQERIKAGVYNPSTRIELALTSTLFVMALLLIAYLVLTS